MKDWAKDINDMHDKYGFHDWVKENVVGQDPEKVRKILDELLWFRLRFLDEELNETKEAAANKDAEEVVDGLIDLIVVAIGTLDIFGVDSYDAWNRVHEANMSKERGIKENRPNPLGLPDLMKPEGWEAPTHEDNHGFLKLTFLN